jgi:hypothetical protein
MSVNVSVTREFQPGPPLDELCSPAELLDELPAHTGKLKVVLGSPDSVSGGFKLRCHSEDLSPSRKRCDDDASVPSAPLPF